MIAGLCVVLPGCGLVLGLGDFKEGGSGGGGTGGAGTGGSTSTSASSSGASTTTGTGGCEVGQTECGGTCVSLDGDNLNCGKCGKACDPQSPSASTCAAASCKPCDSGRADCDGLGSNGCEVELASDRNNCGTCGRTCAGDCASSKCQPVVVASLSNPDFVAVKGGHLFWHDDNGNITMAGLDGSNPTPFPLKGPFTLSATHIYAAQDDGIWRAPFAGGAPEQFLPDVASSLAVDAQNLYVTATTYDDAGTGNTTIKAYNVTTKNPTLIAGGAGGADLFVSDGLLFWLDGSNIYKSSVILGAGTLLAATQPYMQGTLRADANNVFWMTTKGAFTIPIVGADPVTGATSLEMASNPATQLALAIDADSVYWSDVADTVLRKLPKTGGSPTTVASGQLLVLSIAVDDKFIYWTSIGSKSILRIEKNP